MMTLSPKKYVSHYTNSTTQRGVEAKEIDLANTNLELDMSNSTHFPAESSAGSAGRAGEAPPLPLHDDTASYLQVVVEKHRRRGGGGGAAECRLPTASSPLAHKEAAERGVYVLPHPVLLACSAGEPFCPAHTYYTRLGAGGGGCALMEAGAVTAAVSGPGAAGGGTAHEQEKDTGAGAGDAPPHHIDHTLQKKHTTWKIFRDIGTDKFCDDEPERVEVYYFEQGAGGLLATSGGARSSALERAARRGLRPAAALLHEAWAVPRLVAALPLALAVGAERAALLVLRAAATQALHTASDYALKPALALAYNAVLHPLLVFVGAVCRGVREALRPLAAAATDAAEPVARLLAAVRLVDVHLACPHHHV